MSRSHRRQATHQAEGLMGQWLAHHAGGELPGVVETPVPIDTLPERERDLADGLVADAAPDPRLVTMARAGAILEAFADGTLEPERPPAPDAVAAAAVVLDAFHEDHPDARPDREPEPEPQPAAGVPATLEFRAGQVRRRVLALLTLASLVATGGAVWLASQIRTGGAVGVAAGLALLTVGLWVVRARSTAALVTVADGRVEIYRGGTRTVFDLASRRTPVEVVGTPGQRGWQVVFPRRSLAPYVLDASMVDPDAFTRVVSYYRETAA